MSDYDYTEDPWEPWQAQYESNPVETVAELAAHYAQAAAAQHTADPSAIATEAMLQMAQIQQNAQQQAQADEEARLIDRSLAAKHGQAWMENTGAVARRLATDEDLQKRWGTLDTQGRADLLDDVFTEIDNKTRGKTFSEIMAAGSNKLGL